MSAAVVDRLETIEIDKEQRRTRAVALQIGQRPLELALEASAIEHPGQRIGVSMRRKRLDLVARRRKLELKPRDFSGKPHRRRARRRDWRIGKFGG